MSVRQKRKAKARGSIEDAPSTDPTGGAADGQRVAPAAPGADDDVVDHPRQEAALASREGGTEGVSADFAELRAVDDADAAATVDVGDLAPAGEVDVGDLAPAGEVDVGPGDDDTSQGELFADFRDEDDETVETPSTVGDEAHPATLPAGDVSRKHLKGLIEALVFVSDRPVSLNDIARSAGKADRKLVRSLVDELRQEYRGRGIHLEEVAGGLLFRTNPAYGPFIRDAAAKKPVKMTRAQLEALAIIAYRQPLTRPEVDEIRGVDSGPVLKMLLDRDLVRILGKKDEPGRPLLYGTTPVFLEFFGLKSLKDLPSLREFTELSDDSRKVFDREMSDVEGGATPSADTLAAAASAVGEESGESTNAPSPRAEDLEDPPSDPSAQAGDDLGASDLHRATDRSPAIDADGEAGPALEGTELEDREPS